MFERRIASTFSVLWIGIGSGCALEPANEGAIDQIEQAVTVHKVHVFAYSSGNWRESVYIEPNVTSPSVETFSFGIASDVPLVVNSDGSSPKHHTIATYGTTTSGDRRGRFFIDRDGDRDWSTSDTSGKFMSSPQSGDKPFIVHGQLWGRDSSGNCAPRVSSGGTLPVDIEGLMVGIKRGTTLYLDRDGDGVYANGSSHCDITGTFGLSGDLPVAVPSLATSYDVPGTTRQVGTLLSWYVSNNGNATWDGGDSEHQFGDAGDFAPASHPGGFAVQQGRHVPFDANGSRGWNSGDYYYTNVLPSTTWKLVGVGKSVLVL